MSVAMPLPIGCLYRRYDFPQCNGRGLFTGRVTSRRHLRWQYLEGVQPIIITSPRLQSERYKAKMRVI